MAYRGIDGKKYDNFISLLLGDEAYRKQRAEQQTQINLLKEQNQLINLQRLENLELEKEKLNQQKEMQIKQIEHEEDMQIKQIEHDEKMRLLKIFDDIGISKKTYDDFIDNLFGSKKEILEIQSILKNNNIEIEYYTNKIQKTLKEYEEKPEVEIAKLLNQFPETQIELKNYPPEIYQEYKEWIHNPSDYKKDLEDLDIYDELMKIKSMEKEKHLFGKFAFCGIISIVLMLMKAKSKFLSIVFFLSLIPTISSFIKFVTKSKTKEYHEVFQKGLDNFTLLWNYRELNISPKKKLKDYQKTLEDKRKYFKSIEEENSKNIKDTLEKEIISRWEDFNDFRRKHYNSKVEKLFVDMDLKEIVTSLGLDYPTINKNTKIADGTVEDYIAYFETEKK